MAKQVILDPPGYTFTDFSLLTGYAGEDCSPDKVSLETDLAGVKLRIPLLSAAMTSVTGIEMVLALGREGGLPVIPTNIPDDTMADWITESRSQYMSFVEDPLKVGEHRDIGYVLKKMKKHGHTRIPIINRDNVFVGMFDEGHYQTLGIPPSEPVTSAMVSIEDICHVKDENMTIEQAKMMLDDCPYVVVLDKVGHLRKMAFRKDLLETRVAASIDSFKGWKKRVEKAVDAGVDMIVMDTSDAFNVWVLDVLREYKDMGIDVPICAGNVITYDGAMSMMTSGADVIKGGMASGSICSTGREKAVGRAPMSVCMALDKAQADYLKKSGRYVPIIMDGGISSAADMVIALTHVDAVMCGGYFNHFWEAAGEKLDRKGNETNDEDEAHTVATWGEGSARAMNMRRYGKTREGWFEEGVESTVPYSGRMKPTLKTDMRKLRSAMSNAGCKDLSAYRRESEIELLSTQSAGIVITTHNID